MTTYQLLGKTFFEKKKNPLPVNFSKVGWKDQIKRILNSTFFYLRSGTCCAIRVGRLSMEVDQTVDNVMSVVDEAVEKIPKKWGNVRSLHLKAVDSVALPIYQAMPEIGLKIEVGEREDLRAEEVIDRDEVVEQKSEKKKKKKKGGIRYIDGDALAGEELVEEDGELDEGEEKNKKRKNRSKESTGSESTVDEMEMKTKKKNEEGTRGESNADETEVKPKKKKKKDAIVDESNVDKMEGKHKKKKDGTGGESDILLSDAKTEKKKKMEENSEAEDVECAKKKKKDVSNDIVEKVEGREKRKVKKAGASEKVKKGKKK